MLDPPCKATKGTAQALHVELEDAESRMCNARTWTQGSAEVRDALTMHQAWQNDFISPAWVAFEGF